MYSMHAATRTWIVVRVIWFVADMVSGWNSSDDERPTTTSQARHPCETRCEHETQSGGYLAIPVILDVPVVLDVPMVLDVPVVWDVPACFRRTTDRSHLLFAHLLVDGIGILQ